MLTRIRNADYRPGTAGFYGVAALAAIALYALVLGLISDAGPAMWLANTAANVLPLFIVGVLARSFVIGRILSLAPLAQIVAHLVSAFVFAAVWFFLLMVFLGLVAGDAFLSFSVRPFLGAAAVWQMMQGATFYGLLALLVYVESIQISSPQGVVDTTSAPETTTPAPVFVRDGEEMRPLDISRVVCVNAAGDYAEVVTLSGTHTLRCPLIELEKALGASFLRVHRSTIVNIHCVDRVEPAGSGRMSIHLRNGSTVTASRAGAKAIRERAV